jgi:hypothetical protein
MMMNNVFAPSIKPFLMKDFGRGKGGDKGWEDNVGEGKDEGGGKG